MQPCRVVLVRPHYPGNVGAVARVMHNFGLTHLALVEPVADRYDHEARRLATHGEFILDQARIVSTLADAVADCTHIVASSAHVRGVVRETSSVTLRELAPVVIEEMARGPVALVFGPEPTGLTTAEISLGHRLMHIPTNPDFPALNLAQAVAVSLYEIHTAWLNRSETPAAEPRAAFADQERMFEHLRGALEAVHFLYGEKADALMHAVRHLIGRARPTPTEVRILHGLARQLEWVARNGAVTTSP